MTLYYSTGGIMVCHIINDSHLPANSDSCHSKTSIQIYCISICQMSMKEFLIFLIQVTTNHLVTKILEFFHIFHELCQKWQIFVNQIPLKNRHYMLVVKSATKLKLLNVFLLFSYSVLRMRNKIRYFKAKGQ